MTNTVITLLVLFIALPFCINVMAITTGSEFLGDLSIISGIPLVLFSAGTAGYWVFRATIGRPKKRIRILRNEQPPQD